MNKLHKIIIVGASRIGLALASQLSCNESVCIISKKFEENSNQECSSNFTFITGEVVFVSYYQRMIILHLSDNTKICGQNVIFATETTPEYVTEYSYRNYSQYDQDDTVVIYGNNERSAEIACEIHSKVKKVYLFSEVGKLPIDAGLRLRLVNIKNIQWIPRVHIDSVERLLENKIKILYNKVDTFSCDKFYIIPESHPDTSYFPTNLLVDKSDSGEIIVNEFGQTSKIQSIFAIGRCSSNKNVDLEKLTEVLREV